MIPTWGSSFGANAGLIFSLPLNDSGAGAVNTTPASSGGSSTATFTRATTAYTTLSSGLLAQVNSGVARSTYSADGSTYLGYLPEGARTNLALQSQTFDVVAAWSSSGGTTATADTAASPDGTTTADRLQGTTAAWFYGQPVTIVNGTAYTVSLYVKSNTGSAQAVRLFGDANQSSSDLAVTTAWTRISYTFTSANSAARNHGIQRDVANDTVDILVWGFQVEAGAFASTYIPTTTASVTRNADVLTYAVAGNVIAVTGSLYAEALCVVNGPQGGGAGVMSVNDGSSNNRVDLRTADTGNNSTIVTSGGATQAAISVANFVANTVSKMAVAWGSNDARFAANGTAGTPDTSVTVPASITTINVGTLDVASNPLWGSVKNIRIYNRALSTAQLQAMTS